MWKLALLVFIGSFSTCLWANNGLMVTLATIGSNSGLSMAPLDQSLICRSSQADAAGNCIEQHSEEQASSLLYTTPEVNKIRAAFTPSASFGPGESEKEVLDCEKLDLSKDCFSNSPLAGDFFEFSSNVITHLRPQMSYAPNHSQFRRITATDLNNGFKPLFSPTESKFQEHCECLKDQMESEMIGLTNVDKILDEKLQTEREAVNDKILNEYGQKFLNQYAANLEDMSFFLVWSDKMFGDQQQVEKAKELQCNNHRRYLDAIAEKCEDIDPAVRDERINKFLSVFENDRSFKKFEDRLTGLNTEILSISEGGKTFTRTEHDKARYGFSKQPQVQIAEKLIAKILTNEKILTEVQKELGHEEVSSPLEAILRWMESEYQKNPSDFKKSFLSKEVLGEEQYKLFRRSRFSKTPLAFLYDKVINTNATHPGFARALGNEDIFQRLGQKLNQDKRTDVITLLETDPDILPPYLEERCNGLVKGFAEAVCVQDDNLIKSVDRKNLEHILKSVRNENKQIDSRMHALLLCQSSLHQSGNEVFQDLGSKKARLDDSDFLDRKLNPIEMQQNSFVKAFRELQDDKNSSIREVVSRVASLAGEGKGSGGKGILSQEISLAAAKTGKIISFTSDEVNQVAHKKMEMIQESESASAFSNNNSENILRQPASVSELHSAQFTAAPDSNYSQVKNEMSRFLSKDRDVDEVKKHLANIDEKSLLELQRIKEESLRDQERLYEISNQNEELKLKALQKKVQDLMNRRDEIDHVDESNVVEAPRVENERRVSTNQATPVSGTFKQEIVPAAAPARSFNASNVTPTSGITNAGSSSRSKQEIANNIATQTKLAGAIIIESSVTKTDGREIAPNDLSQEIISYLMKAQPDLLTLKQMKEKGMLYKFKTLKNGVFVEEEVLVPFDSLTAAAKRLIEVKIAEKKDPAIEELDRQIASATREHSFQALKLIIGEQLQKK